jgi:hypothetical protein
MKDMFNNLIEKVKVWGEKDWDNNVNEDGELEVYNNVGGVDYVLNRSDYFGKLEEVKNFSELESWWMSIIGMDGDGGFASWLDEVIKVKEL